MTVDGLVAIVTGASSGIGAACVRKFLSMGASVGAIDLAPGSWEHERVCDVTADVTDGESLRQATRMIADRFGGIDALVNNAGVSAVGAVEDNAPAEWHRVLDVNVVGMARMTTAALPYLRRSGHAAIVNVSSVAASVGIQNRVLYGASKGAVHAFTLALAADLVSEGIRVNSVAPGTVDTPWVSRLLQAVDSPEIERSHLEARQPIGRLVRAEEVAGGVVYLAHPSSGATTGSCLRVDGGMSGLRTHR